MKKSGRNFAGLGTLKAALLLSVLGSSAAMAQDAAAPAAPAPAPMTTPSMAGPITANPNPFYVDTDVLGKIYIGGDLSGLAYYQDNATKLAPGDYPSYMDLTNAQVTVQKTDGWFQFYVQAGDYSFPTVGAPYTKSSYATPSSFGVVPVAYVKLQGQDALADFSIQAGKLFTLIGDEYNFTFENMNIERGLLWNVEPAISRGVQVNYSSGPLNVSFSWNDGTYSNRLNVLSGLISYAIAPTDTVAFSASGNLGKPYFSYINSGSVYNLIYTHSEGNWVISPYIQYVSTPNLGVGDIGTSEWGEALLVSYSFDDMFKLAGRFEYESSTGYGKPAANIIGYGAGSDAWEFTVTPTFQYKQFYLRPEFSYINVDSAAPGAGFGLFGAATTQTRVMVETGVAF